MLKCISGSKPISAISNLNVLGVTRYYSSQVRILGLCSLVGFTKQVQKGKSQSLEKVTLLEKYTETSANFIRVCPALLTILGKIYLR